MTDLTPEQLPAERVAPITILDWVSSSGWLELKAGPNDTYHFRRSAITRMLVHVVTDTTSDVTVTCDGNDTVLLSVPMDNAVALMRALRE